VIIHNFPMIHPEPMVLTVLQFLMQTVVLLLLLLVEFLQN